MLAKDQFVNDCGSDSVVRVASTMLITNRTVCISDNYGDITWSLLPDGYSYRIDGCTIAHYDIDGNRISLLEHSL